MKIIRRLLKRWADPVLQKRLLELESQLEAERRRLAVSNVEIESLAAVIARDRERIRSEGACYARQRAEAEGVMNESRIDQSTR
jgi:hypothetical protein